MIRSTLACLWEQILFRPRVARDVMLGLMKTCQKLGLSFYHYLGDRLGLGDADQAVPPLPTIILARV